MGETIRLKCNDCGNSYELGIGHGMADNRLDTVLGYFDEVSAERIRRILPASDKGYRWSYRKMIGYCSSCRSYIEIPTFSIMNNEENTTVAATCRCGNNCMLIDDNDKARMNSLLCPKCNGKMTAEIAGMWD
ncbi:MAG: hypothetical protein IKO16_08970 [Lachnospiraceae bacterium]|nr:hypothetical protein [Lachnospiraceae bacterium]